MFAVVIAHAFLEGRSLLFYFMFQKRSTELLRLAGIFWSNNPEQGVQAHDLSGLKYLQGWRLHNLSGQPVPVSDQFHKKAFSCI